MRPVRPVRPVRLVPAPLRWVVTLVLGAVIFWLALALRDQWHEISRQYEARLALSRAVSVPEEASRASQLPKAVRDAGLVSVPSNGTTGGLIPWNGGSRMKDYSYLTHP